MLGIIGGSGIYDLPGLENTREERIASPWGEPSGALRIGTIAGLPVAFLPRHDTGHRLSPSDINYRANIDVLKRAGVTDLVSLSACGSFREELPPGTFVLVDQFVDRTHLRANSFFGSGCVAHVSMAHPVSPRLRIHLAGAAEAEGLAVVRNGTYVCIEGPQFSTLAESLTYQALGYAVMAGPDDKDATSLLQPEVELAGLENGDLSGVRLGVYRPWFEDADPAVVVRCQALVDGLVAAGATLASDYNFRGISQSARGPSAWGYGEIRYNVSGALQFYAALGGDTVDFPNRARAEFDLYGGIRPKFGKLSLDLGAWYYAYPGGTTFNATPPSAITCANGFVTPSGFCNVVKGDVSFIEAFAKAAYAVDEQVSLGANLFYSPNWLNSGAPGT